MESEMGSDPSLLDDQLSLLPLDTKELGKLFGLKERCVASKR